MKKPALKVELIDGLQVIKCRKEDLDWESGKALSICVADFRGQKSDPLRNVIYIEWYDGKLQVRMYDKGEDPVRPAEATEGSNNDMAMVVKPDPALTKAVYCPLEELPKLLSSEDEDVREIVEQRLKENNK